MSEILLIGKGWQARALLRAQLLEEGFDVEAHESLASALERLDSSEILPALVVADVSASDDPEADIQQLAAWTDQLPVWMIAAPSIIRRQTLKGRGFEMILFRPVDLGELVEQIKRRLA
jgi:DNA-binding NtrC family response regulator